MQEKKEEEEINNLRELEKIKDFLRAWGDELLAERKAQEEKAQKDGESRISELREKERIRAENRMHRLGAAMAYSGIESGYRMSVRSAGRTLSGSETRTIPQKIWGR